LHNNDGYLLTVNDFKRIFMNNNTMDTEEFLKIFYEDIKYSGLISVRKIQ